MEFGHNTIYNLDRKNPWCKKMEDPTEVHIKWIRQKNEQNERKTTMVMMMMVKGFIVRSNLFVKGGGGTFCGRRQNIDSRAQSSVDLKKSRVRHKGTIRLKEFRKIE